MANNIEIIITAVDNASENLKKIGSSIKSVGSSVESVTQPMANISKQIAAMEVAMAALSGTILIKAIDAAKQFNTAFGEISTMISGPKENLGQFKSQIIEYSKASTQSMDSITKATYNAISMGASYSESLGVVRSAEKLATAGKAELNSTLEVIMGSLNAYGKSMDESASFSDKLFTTVAQGKTTIPELGASLSQVTSIAASTGVSFDEVLAAIATLTSAGMPTAQAVTSIKAAISGLTMDTGAYADAANSMGIQLGVSAIQSKGLAGMMEEIKTKTGGSEQKIKSLFGSIEAYGAVVALAGNNNAKFVSSLDAVQNSTGATSEAFGKMEQNVNQLLSNNINAFLIKLGDGLDKSADSMKSSIASIFGGLSASVDVGAFDSIKNAIKGTIGDISLEMAKLGKNLPLALKGVDFSELVSIINSVKNAIVGLFQSMGSNNPNVLRETIQTIVNVFTSLGQVLGGMIEAFSPFMGLIIDAIQNFAGLEEGALSVIGELLGFGTVANTLAPYIIGLGKNFGDLGGTILELPEIFETINAIPEGLKGVSEFISGIPESAAEMVDGIASIPGEFKNIADSVMNLPGQMKELGSSLMNLGSQLTQLGPAIGVAAAGFVAFKIGEWAVENIPAVTKIKDGLTDLAESIFGLADLGSVTEASILEDQIASLSEKTGDATITADNYREKLRAYYNEQGKVSTATQTAVQATDKLTQSQKKQVQEVSLTQDELKELYKQLSDMAGSVFEMKMSLIREGDPNAVAKTIDLEKEKYNQLKQLSDGTLNSRLQLTRQTLGQALKTYQQYAQKVKELESGITDEKKRQANVIKGIDESANSGAKERLSNQFKEAVQAGDIGKAMILANNLAMKSDQELANKRTEYAKMTSDIEQAMKDKDFAKAVEIAKAQEALGLKIAQDKQANDEASIQRAVELGQISQDIANSKIESAASSSQAESKNLVLDAQKRINEAMAKEKGIAQDNANTQLGFIEQLNTSFKDLLDEFAKSKEGTALDVKFMPDTKEIDNFIEQMKNKSLEIPVTTSNQGGQAIGVSQTQQSTTVQPLDKTTSKEEVMNVELKPDSKELDDYVQSKQGQVLNIKLMPDSSQIESLIERLKQPTESVHTITVKKEGVQAATGGLIKGPGTTTSDSIPAWLSNREYVIPAKSVDYFGVDFFHSLRSLQMPRFGFATGGLATAAGPQTFMNQITNITNERDLNPIQVNVGDHKIPLYGRTESAKALRTALRDLKRG
jgi:TP901 family phage tail tape measure protein